MPPPVPTEPAGVPPDPVATTREPQQHRHADDACCPPHGHHVIPHRRCILR